MRNRLKRAPALHSDQVDIIVIGSGFAGMAAAIEAAESGASVVILEKMMAPGGNSIISDGGIAAPDTVYQKVAGIDDSPEMMYQDMMAAGEGLNYPELVRIVAEGAKEAFLWTKDYLGVRYKNRVDIFGGHSVPRCYTPDTISGRALIEKQLAKLLELNVPILLGTYVKTLIADENDGVVGVQIMAGFRPQPPCQATEATVISARAVIVATGGFGNDIPFRRSQDPRLGNNVQSTNKAFATAEILKECVRIGANPVQLSRIQLAPFTSPDERGYGAGPLFGDYVVLPYGMIIDPATGGRFANELANRKVLADAIMQRQQPVIGIADSNGVQAAGWNLDKALKRGVVKTFPSIKELAQHYEVDPETLKSSIASYNSMVIAGRDQVFDKPILSQASPLEKSPFYAMRIWPKVHHTMGGVQIDRFARVINRDQHPIPGLFAAGEVTGGIHGACRLGSCAVTDCIVFGRIAGKNAVSMDENQTG